MEIAPEVQCAPHTDAMEKKKITGFFPESTPITCLSTPSPNQLRPSASYMDRAL